MVERAEQAQRLLRRELFGKTCLLKLNAETLPQFLVVRAPFEPEHLHVPLVRLEQSLENLDRRGLACAVRAEQTEAFAALDRQRQAVNGDHVAVAFPQVLAADSWRVDHDQGLCNSKCTMQMQPCTDSAGLCQLHCAFCSVHFAFCILIFRLDSIRVRHCSHCRRRTHCLAEGARGARRHRHVLRRRSAASARRHHAPAAEVVLLDRLFADTSRGTALINRIKADPSLGNCEIRIVEDDRSYSQVPLQRAAGGGPTGGSGGGAAGIVVEDLPSPPSTALDQIGTRNAPRFKVVDGIEVEIDGNPATLVEPVGIRRAGRLAHHPQAEPARAVHHVDKAAHPAQGRRRLGGVRDPEGKCALSRRHPAVRRRPGRDDAVHRPAQGIAATPLSHCATAEPAFTIVSCRSEPVDTIAHSTPLTSSSRSM